MNETDENQTNPVQTIRETDRTGQMSEYENMDQLTGMMKSNQSAQAAEMRNADQTEEPNRTDKTNEGFSDPGGTFGSGGALGIGGPAQTNDLSDGKTPAKRKSIFQITAAVLIVLLAVTIVVQICVMSNLKRRRDELNRRNDQIPALPEEPEDAALSGEIVVENQSLKIFL